MKFLSIFHQNHYGKGHLPGAAQNNLVFEHIWIFPLQRRLLLCWLIVQMALWLSRSFTGKSQLCPAVTVDPSRSWHGHCTKRGGKRYWLGGNPHGETRTPKRWVCIVRTRNLSPPSWHFSYLKCLYMEPEASGSHCSSLITAAMLVAAAHDGRKSWLAWFFSDLSFV